MMEIEVNQITLLFLSNSPSISLQFFTFLFGLITRIDHFFSHFPYIDHTTFFYKSQMARLLLLTIVSHSPLDLSSPTPPHHTHNRSKSHTQWKTHTPWNKRNRKHYLLPSALPNTPKTHVTICFTLIQQSLLPLGCSTTHGTVIITQ